MSKPMNERGAITKTHDLGGGQKLIESHGRDDSDFRGTSRTKLGGGVKDLSRTLNGATLPKGVKDND